MKTNLYSSPNIPLSQKILELVSIFFSVHLRRIFKPEEEILRVFSDFELYNKLLLNYSNVTLESAKVLEIGFGARPNRLISLTSMGVDACGVDLEMPVLRGISREFIAILKENGVERLLKSILRFTFFDLNERWYLSKALQKRGHNLKINEDRFFVDDAVNLKIQPHSLDLIFSEDVFEHIPPHSLKVLIPTMAQWLKPNGLALIRPNIFTGITGGHLAEWFPQALENKNMQRKSEPWEHLSRNRYQANTYLNQLSRSDYRNLFSSAFQILEERVKDPNLGREFLSPEVLVNLKGYSDEELFSNLTLFVLKPKSEFRCSTCLQTNKQKQNDSNA